MQPRLYRDLTPWYHLIDPPQEHADEAGTYRDALLRGVAGRAETLLDLGAGAGNNALHLKDRFRCTLVDLSPEMLALSRAQNPTCEHLEGDLRTLRLGRAFDAVLLHDAVMYMTTEDDLRAAFETAWAHTRPGGAAVVTPDTLAETFTECSELLSGDDGSRAVSAVAWQWDPSPDDSTYVVDYAFLLREGATVTAVHDRHVEGLFSRATWTCLLEETGFRVELVARPIGDGEFDVVFLCRRPMG